MARPTLCCTLRESGYPVQSHNYLLLYLWETCTDGEPLARCHGLMRGRWQEKAFRWRPEANKKTKAQFSESRSGFNWVQEGQILPYKRTKIRHFFMFWDLNQCFLWRAGGLSKCLFIVKPLNFVKFVFGYEKTRIQIQSQSIPDTDPDTLILDPKDWSQEICIERTSTTRCGCKLLRRIQHCWKNTNTGRVDENFEWLCWAYLFVQAISLWRKNLGKAIVICAYLY